MAAAIKQRRLTPEEERESRLVQQVDSLQKISQKQRRDQLGDEWFKTVRELYNLFEKNANDAPIFRPAVRIPKGQVLGLQEAIDLSDIDPLIYLVKSAENQQRDENNEACFQAQWRDSNTNLQIMYANLWSWFVGNGFIQVGWDETRRRGRGDLTVSWRDPETVYPDPYASDDQDWQYVLIEDFLWLDRVHQLWPVPAQRVVEKRAANPQDEIMSARFGSQPGFGLEVPLGPLQASIPGLPVSTMPGDSRVRVRTLFLRDASTVTVNGKQQKLEMSGVPRPTRRMRYPRGRMIIECNGIILYDDENPYLHGEFPIVRFLGNPALHGFWPPPPFRYTKSLQDLAERIYTGYFENLVRLNNGIWIIDEATGIDVERFGGVPGEVQVKAANSPDPTFIQPKGIGSDALTAISDSLILVRDLQGFSDARQGHAPQGNVSSNLFEGQVGQSQTLTRGRARMLFSAIRRLAWLMFATQAQYTDDQRTYADPRTDGFGLIKWQPIDRDLVEDYILHIDPSSVMPFSAAMMRAQVPMMRNMGLLDVQSSLEALRWPNRKRVLERLGQEAQMRAQMGEVAEARRKVKKG